MLTSTTTQYAMGLKLAAVVTGVPQPLDVNDGDVLQLSSPDGTFRVEFHPWPFAEPEPSNGITTTAPFTFKNAGPNILTFTADCYITPAGSSTEYGYPGTWGTNGSVRPPGK